MTFTPEMGARIEQLASRKDLYASSYIREVMEVHVIDQERRPLAADQDRKASRRDRLREELVLLNESLMRISGQRETVVDKIRKIDNGHDNDEEIDDRALDFDAEDEDEEEETEEKTEADD